MACDLNKMEPCGYQWLVQRYSLNVCELLCQSFMTGKSTKRIEQTGDAVKTFYPVRKFRTDDVWQGHLLFALKHEGINIEVLRAFFKVVPAEELKSFIALHPLGAIQKRVWFLYEFLSGNELDIPDGGGGYIALVDENLQFALPLSHSPRVRRHHIVNNLIGNASFSPYIRKTAAIRGFSADRLRSEANRLLDNYSPELLYRAVQYLYIKETKSSFAIERETPDQRRTDAFVSVLKGLGETNLSREVLVEAQNSVVDARYRQNGWRDDQVYVGETLAPGHEKVHYVAPRPDALEDLMDGYLRCLSRWMEVKGGDSVAMAAVLGFAFVFLHPFDDGNGRVHRYVLHAVLAQRGFVPHGLIFPVSATMLKHRLEYDKALETFSCRLMPRLDYDVSAEGEVTVANDSRDLYRAIDYTPIVEYFQRTIAQTIRTEWKTELDYLKRYDRIRSEMRKVVDMPDKQANQFVLFALQNGGRLSKAKRGKFPELTDAEISRMETLVSDAMDLQITGK